MRTWAWMRSLLPGMPAVLRAAAMAQIRAYAAAACAAGSFARRGGGVVVGAVEADAGVALGALAALFCGLSSMLMRRLRSCRAVPRWSSRSPPGGIAASSLAALPSSRRRVCSSMIRTRMNRGGRRAGRPSWRGGGRRG